MLAHSYIQNALMYGIGLGVHRQDAMPGLDDIANSQGKK